MRLHRFALSALLLASPALADEVDFKNGDKLTGTIVQTSGDQLTIDTSIAGTVIVKMKDVKTFSTDEPVVLKFKDGTTINDKVATSEPGSVTTAGTGAVKSQDVALEDLTAINPPTEKWSGDVTAGGLITRGNSNAEQFNLGADATRRTDIDRIITHGQYLFGRTTDPSTGQTSTTTDNWLLSGEYNYFFNKQLFGYGLAGVQKDRIADLDIRVTPGAGVGYQWVERPTLNFETEAGIGWLYESYTNTGTTGGDTSDEYVNGRLAYHVDTMVNDKVKLFNDFQVLDSLQSFRQFQTTETAGVRVTLTKRMFAELKNLWQYDSNPAVGAKKNDLSWILSVGWLF